MMELPYINGKTIKTIATFGDHGSIDEVRLTHSDGSILIITGEYIKIRLELRPEPACPEPSRRVEGQAAPISSVSAVSSGLAARALEEAIGQGKAIEMKWPVEAIPSLGIKVTPTTRWPGE